MVLCGDSASPGPTGAQGKGDGFGADLFVYFGRSGQKINLFNYFDIVNYANTNGLKVVDVGATIPVSASCQNVIESTGANVSTPLKPLPKVKQ